MSSFRLSNQAVHDLLDIGRYTQKKWGIEQRNTYLKKLDDCFYQLSENPNLGIQCDYIAKGYRKFPQQSHVIYYRMSSDSIVEIIRILHKLMDVESKF
ncbi:type II toxin-antitoxin system RelE/ParE family toxin [bacterium]|nr:type II toxin-antitoxin system RelE/ParE family toxin [bacterium]